MVDKCPGNINNAKVGFGCYGGINCIEEISEDEIKNNIYLNCIPWDGSEKSLPAGVKTLIPQFSAISLVRSWEILDVDADEGFRQVKPADIQPSDIIIGAVISEAAFSKVCSSYGKDALLFRRADTGKLMTRGDWIETYHMDPLELQAIKEGR